MQAFIVMDMMKMCAFAAEGQTQPCFYILFDCGFFDFIIKAQYYMLGLNISFACLSLVVYESTL